MMERQLGRESQKDNDLFYTCSLIDYIARKTKNKRVAVVDADKHFKHSDYRADGIWYYFFFRLSKIYKLVFYNILFWIKHSNI